MKRKLCFIITFSLLLCIFCLPAYADPVSTPDNVSVLRFSSTRFVEYKFVKTETPTLAQALYPLTGAIHVK